MNRLCLLIFLMIEAIPVFAQTHPKTKGLSDSVAAAMCRCMDNTFLGIDDDVRNLIVNAINDTVNGSLIIQNYLAEVDQERAAQINEQLQKLGSIDSDLTCCFNESTQRLKNLQIELEGLSESEQLLVASEFETEEKTVALLMESMRTRSDCNF